MKAIIAAAVTLLALAGCNRKEASAPEVDVQKGIDRSVADVRAARAAAAAPVAQSQSVGELTRKSDAAEAPATD